MRSCKSDILLLAWIVGVGTQSRVHEGQTKLQYLSVSLYTIESYSKSVIPLENVVTFNDLRDLVGLLGLFYSFEMLFGG